MFSVQTAIRLAPALASLPLSLILLAPSSHLPSMHLGYPFYAYDRDDEPMYASFAAVSENAKSALATAQADAVKLFTHADTSKGAVVVDVKGPHIVTLLRPGPSTRVSHRPDAYAEFIRWARAHGFKAVARKITDAEKRAFYASKARKGPVVCVPDYLGLADALQLDVAVREAAAAAKLAARTATSPVKTNPRSQAIGGPALKVATPLASPVKARSVVNSPVKAPFVVDSPFKPTAVADIESGFTGLQV